MLDRLLDLFAIRQPAVHINRRHRIGCLQRHRAEDQFRLMQIMIFQLADVADLNHVRQRRVIFVDLIDQRDRFRPAPSAHD